MATRRDPQPRCPFICRLIEAGRCRPGDAQLARRQRDGITRPEPGVLQVQHSPRSPSRLRTGQRRRSNKCAVVFARDPASLFAEWLETGADLD